MNLDRVLQRNPEAAFRVYEGKATVVLPGRGEVNVVNDIGTRIWEAIDGKKTLKEILDTVVEEYDISHEQARSDLDDFVASLDEHGMVA